MTAIETARRVVESGGTRQQAADAAGVSRATVHRWQALGWRPPTLRQDPVVLRVLDEALRQAWTPSGFHRRLVLAGVECSSQSAGRLLRDARQEQRLDNEPEVGA